MHFWGFFQFTHGSNPSPDPTNNVGRVYPDFFSEFQLCIGWGEGVGGRGGGGGVEGELQENFEKGALFHEGTEK